MGFTSDALHATLVGSWVSVLTFRRQAMAIMSELFKTIPPAELDTGRPQVRDLFRAASEELQLLASLSPILASNIAVPFDEQVFATDASTEMGGIAVTTLPTEVVGVLWRSADQKGANMYPCWGRHRRFFHNMMKCMSTASKQVK